MHDPLLCFREAFICGFKFVLYRCRPVSDGTSQGSACNGFCAKLTTGLACTATGEH